MEYFGWLVLTTYSTQKISLQVLFKALDDKTTVVFTEGSKLCLLATM